jgi:very-short-patch-repair endonuclease
MEHISAAIARLARTRAAYESDPEEALGERLRDSLAPGVQLTTQVWVDTEAGPFRLDLLLTRPGRRVAIEVDGQHHDLGRDRWRTVFIVSAGKADVVYRVPAVFVYSNLIGVLAGLARVEPQCFKREQRDRWCEVAQARWEQSDSGSSDEIPDDCEGSGEDSWSPKEGWLSSRAFAMNFRCDIQECSARGLEPYLDFVQATGLRDVDLLKQAWERRYRTHAPSYADTCADPLTW